MTVEEIHAFTHKMGQAARRAREAGVDAVEIHAAHRHGVLGTFLSPLSNKRVDDYGGSVDGRLRFLLEVIAEVRRAAGEDYPIIVRMSMTEFEPGGQSMLDAIYIARRLEKARVSLLNLSNGTLETYWKTVTPNGTPRGVNTELSKQIKDAVSIPVGVIGRNCEPWAAEQVLDLGRTDAVYMARALLCDPEFPNKAREGRVEEIRPCIGCLRCLSRVNADMSFCCTVNPEAGREWEISAPWPQREKKRVLVVGGGPGGLTAAAYAAERGHHVTLMERDSRLGGQMYLAAIPPCKQEIAKGTYYMIRRAEQAGVEILLNTEATQENVEQGGYDLVIVAAGSRNVLPRFLSGAKQLVTARDALEGKVLAGRNTVVVGGGPVGCETADYLIHPHHDLSVYGRRVTIIEMDTVLAREEQIVKFPLELE